MRRISSVIMLGPAHPFRGGLAGFDHTLARTFTSTGKRCRIVTFTTQYPSLLFPGKTQFADGPPPEGVDITRELSTVNPISWIRTGRRIRKAAPDAVVVRYWIPFMALSLGTVCRIARRNKKTKVLALLDNVTPHEKRPFDRSLTRYFINSVDGFVYMSEQVRGELQMFDRSKPALFAPHPMFTHYGPRLGRGEACRELGLDPSLKYAMFFGFIRDYKGLDLLLEAWARLKGSEALKGRKLIIAGEYYGGREKYDALIEKLGLGDDLVMMTRFIPDGEVGKLFSAVDLVVQPYKSATQSGVTQVAYYYEVPMIVTGVGGLREIVPDGRVGYVVEPDPAAIAAAIERYYRENREDEFRAGIRRYREHFTWESFAAKFEELYDFTL